jgi:hypothetical protein
MGTHCPFYIWLCQSVSGFVVYPPFDAPHMLPCRGTCHDRTQFLREPCQVVKQNLSLFIHDIFHERFHPALLRPVHISLLKLLRVGHATFHHADDTFALISSCQVTNSLFMVLKAGPSILPSASFTLEKASMIWKRSFLTTSSCCMWKNVLSMMKKALCTGV